MAAEVWRRYAIALDAADGKPLQASAPSCVRILRATGDAEESEDGGPRTEKGRGEWCLWIGLVRLWSVSNGEDAFYCSQSCCS